eukprot:2338956-Pyramimonas_sp.AAC.1
MVADRRAAGPAARTAKGAILSRAASRGRDAIRGRASRGASPEPADIQTPPPCLARAIQGPRTVYRTSWPRPGG